MTEHQSNSTIQNKNTGRCLEGVVLSKNNTKTIVVSVKRILKHRLYGKSYSVTRKFHVHDPKEQYNVGDTVEFKECRPMSKLKKWSVTYRQ
ncbi:MAG TPA: 30S ribosomal protein S17 [Patescibacteria group bacterium]|nr:30S ribosomal protein S17 [Patescibacteria group bacterium]